MSVEKYSCYEFEIVGSDVDTDNEQYHYIIYLDKNYLGQDDWIESDEYYDTRQEARFSAIGRISLLENGEG